MGLRWIIIGCVAFGILLFLVGYTDAPDILGALNPLPDVGTLVEQGEATR